MAADPSATTPARQPLSGSKRSFDIAFLVSSASEPAAPVSPPASSSSAFTRVQRVPAPETAASAPLAGEQLPPLQPRAVLGAAKLGLQPRLPLPYPLHVGLELLHKPLLPPLATYSLGAMYPSQNVCALCRISFRMTSDLVYHMRSHHRRQEDHHRRAREEKLRCDVCGETFRERHHLTRHMTAHTERDEEEAR